MNLLKTLRMRPTTKVRFLFFDLTCAIHPHLLAPYSVTIIVSGDDHDDALEASDTDGVIFDDNPLDSVPPLPHDDVPTAGLDEAPSDSLIHEASEHAEI